MIALMIGGFYPRKPELRIYFVTPCLFFLDLRIIPSVVGILSLTFTDNNMTTSLHKMIPTSAKRILIYPILFVVPNHILYIISNEFYLPTFHLFISS